MNYNRQLQASFWLMLAVQTIGSLDMPGKGPRKLPSPRSFVAAIVVWAILGLVSDAGGGKAAAAMGWVTVLTGMVVGPFGKGVLNFFTTISTRFVAGPPPATPPATTPSPGSGGTPGGGSVSGSKPTIA